MSSYKTWSMRNEPLPQNFDNVTYVNRERLLEALQNLACDKPGYYDGSELYDPERLHSQAVALLLAYICDFEITDAFNQVPSL